MARIDKATVMQCDRCGKNKWYKDLDDPDIKTWYNTIRLDADGSCCLQFDRFVTKFCPASIALEPSCWANAMGSMMA